MKNDQNVSELSPFFKQFIPSKLTNADYFNFLTK